MPTGPARKLLGVDVTRTDTVQQHEPGVRIHGSDGRTYVYVANAAAIALGDVLTQDYASGTWNMKTTPASADAPMNGAWPNEGGRAAITVAGFFWMLVGGDALVKSAAAVVVGAGIATIATAGTVDDTAASAANAFSAAAAVGGVFVTVASGGFARVMFNGH